MTAGRGMEPGANDFRCAVQDNVVDSPTQMMLRLEVLVVDNLF